jgi:diguanylate cyclase (GGDEF)-like protein
LVRFRPGRRIADSSGDRPDRYFLAQIILPTVAVLSAMAGLLGAFMILAAGRADDLAAGRQQHLIATVLAQSFFGIPHDQEAMTVRDEAVLRIRAPNPDLAWIDSNMGISLYRQYGHDEVYILDPDGHAIYAMREGRRAPPDSYRRAATVAAPLLAELRHRLRSSSKTNMAAAPLSTGVIDLANVDGHPAIISARPIVSDSGRIIQTPGREFIHISIRHLDGAFVSAMARKYELQNAYFSRTRPRGSGLRSIDILNRSNHSLGYFIWTPFRPGTVMVLQIAPAMTVALLLVFVIAILLLKRIRKSALQLGAANIQAHHLAFHDTLTGLPNRALFDDRLARELGRARRENGTVALLVIDVDNFKRVNDSLGHPAGDELLSAIGSLLVRMVGPDDVVARIGGDEFAVIRYGTEAVVDVAHLCDRIAYAIGRPIDIADGQIASNVSIGIAIAPADASEPIELVRKADIALYDAKMSGRSCHCFFTEEMDAKLRNRTAIEADLREALAAGNQLEVYYQPFFSTQSGRITGIEALVRWHHPVHGLLLPSSFVPVAEECGLIEALGEWVLEQACYAACEWPVGSVSVNVSPVQLRNPVFANHVFAILKRTRLDPTRLELEITETSFLESSDQCRFNLGRLRDIGVKMALDDFGTGYSSFQHLQYFDVDRIKIDHTFVTGIDLATGGSSIIRAIIDLARANGLQTTAEGVETDEQRTFLVSVGCNSLQGYLFSRPLRRSQIDRLLAKENA